MSRIAKGEGMKKNYTLCSVSTIIFACFKVDTQTRHDAKLYDRHWKQQGDGRRGETFRLDMQTRHDSKIYDHHLHRIGNNEGKKKERKIYPT